MSRTHAVLGLWNVICPVCGRKLKSDQLVKRWDGVMVCKEDWEPRHPQDLLRITPEDTSVPYPYSEPADTFSAGTRITDADRNNL